MPEANDSHPSSELLSEFALGLLDEDQITAIGRHLSDCAPCRHAAANTTDRVLELLRPEPEQTLDPCAVPSALRHHCRYRILRSLGNGGMGSVYLAEHRVMKQLRAIKVISPAHIGNASAVRRFVREIELQAQLHHPSIVQAFDAEEVNGLYLLVMEYVEGENLADVLERQGPLPISVACEYARQVADGLQYAHERGLVHRDIKPANLIRRPDGEIKILDFGLARLEGESAADNGLTRDHAALGTPAYSAPEQALDAREVDICADIYSLGCTLFSLLTGKPPFEESSDHAVFQAHLHASPRSLREFRPDAPAALCDLVQRMLAKLSPQRPQTPAEVAACLAQFIEPAIAPPRKALLSRMATALRGRSLRVASIAVWCLVLAGASIAWRATTLRVATPDGTILLEQVPDGAEVSVDGRRIELRLPRDRDVLRIEVPVGKRELKISKAGFEAFTRELTLASGRSETIKVKLEPAGAAPARPPAVLPAGWLPLFNGEDLSGWRTWDGRAAGWTVQAGILVGRTDRPIGRGQQPILYSERGDFEDFDLRVEALIADGAGSGVRFRCPFTPHDPFAYEVPLNATSGDAYRTGSVRDLAPPAGPIHEPNEWFTLEVSARGEHIVTKVDGKTVVSLRDRRFKKGHIALLPNWSGTEVRFRRIDIRPMSPSHAPLDAGARGLVSLFNGRDFHGWHVPVDGPGSWAIEDGALVARGPLPNLCSEHEFFENFHLRAEYRVARGGRGRIGFRSYRSPYPDSPQGYYVLLDATDAPAERSGSIDGLFIVRERFDTVGDWNTLNVLAQGQRLRVKVNGNIVIDGHDPRFRMGNLQLESRVPGTELRFRKIEIEELPPG